MHKKITRNQEQAVLELFFTQYDNSVPTIAEMTNLTEDQVHKVINRELKSKMKNQKNI